MRRAALLALALSASAGASPLPFPIRVETLDNGFRVAMVNLGSGGTVALYTLVRVGSRNEVEPGHTGFAHLFEHIMFRGTERFPADVQRELIQRLGYDDNAWTSEDNTVYTPYGPTAGLARILEREADRMRHLKYSRSVFQTETKAVLGEYNKSYSDPSLKMLELLLKTAFSRHTYRHTVIGFLSDIKRMPQYYDYSLKFHQRYYTPDNCILFVVGDFDEEAVLSQARALYGPWKGTVHRPKFPEEPPARAEKRVTLDWQNPTQVRIMVGYRTPSGYRESAIQTILGDYLLGPISRLHEDLVLDWQVVERMDVWFQPHRDPRLFNFVIVLKRDDVTDAVLAAVDAQVERLRAGDVDEQLFRDVQSHVRTGTLLRLQTPAQIAGSLAWHASSAGHPDGLGRHLEAIQAVQPGDLVKFAHEHLQKNGRTIVTLQPRAR